MSKNQPLEVVVAPRVAALPHYIFGQLNALRDKLSQAGGDPIDLGMGNPSDSAPRAAVAELCRAARDPQNHRYSDAQGILELRQAAAQHYRERWGAQLDPVDEIVCAIGSKEGISHLCLALLGSGDIVLASTPAFPIHHHAPRLAGASVVTFPLGPDEAMARDINDLAQRLRPRPKLLILNFPNNPTAATVEPDFFRDIVRIAKKFRFLVLQDFAYGATCFDGYHAPSFLAIPGGKDVGIEFSTMSKEFSMAGWRVGFGAGHRDIVAALRRLKSYYDYGLFRAVQLAAIAALRSGQKDAARQARVYQRRRDVLVNGLRSIGWPCVPPRGGMFVWVEIPAPFQAKGSMAFTMRLLEKAQVVASPGCAFGEEGEGFLRLAIVENETRLDEAIRRIGRHFSLNRADRSETRTKASRRQASGKG